MTMLLRPLPLVFTFRSGLGPVVREDRDRHIMCRLGMALTHNLPIYWFRPRLRV